MCGMWISGNHIRLFLLILVREAKERRRGRMCGVSISKIFMSTRWQSS